MKKYIICILLLFIFIIITKHLFNIRVNKYLDKSIEVISNYEIIEEDNKVYPYFNYEVLDNKVNTYKNNLINNKVNVSVNGSIVYILFINKDKEYSYINIIYDIKNMKFLSINDILDINIIKDNLLDNINNKYSEYIYNNIDFNKIYIDDKNIYFYIKDINYKVYISYNNTLEVSNTYDKVVAFTFDDGPSKYTESIMKLLLLHESSGTFFMLGNRMKYNQSIVNNLINNGMEIGSHTYSHKNLVNLDNDELLSEINSTKIIYNEITNEDIKLTRVPYGSSNETVIELINTPIIYWSLDSLDWLHRDKDYIVNKVIDNISDGDIVLFHDIYPSTLEALKEIIPLLIENGYKITTVSDMYDISNITLENGIIYSKISH